MVRKERKRISYVLPLGDSTGGHRLGVNGLAVDSYNSILYSGGRDGAICAWELNLNLDPFADNSHETEPLLETNGEKRKPSSPASTLRQDVQAHTHWINDICLAADNQALVSASSDLTVKVWRPAAQDVISPPTIGVHTDYVKVLASPGPYANWVASGGLDRKVSLWDLEGAGRQLQIAVGEEDNAAKGSVYALAATSTVLASGGPESIVRVWDARSGKRVTKFVGHTDVIRDVLIAQDGDTILSASADQTVKVWSMTAGRCMYTLTMHHDSVWSLYSNHPRLSVFYSSDRSGLVAKTDCRGYAEMDEGLSVALCQEHNGVSKIVGAGDYLWTATSSSSINRWSDVDTEGEVQMPEPFRPQRNSVATTRSKVTAVSEKNPQSANGTSDKQIPFKSVLRLSTTVPTFFQVQESESQSLRKGSQSHEFSDLDHNGIVPIRNLPDYTIEGQNGLIKHHMLKDRRRVLTVDTAGEVTLWDLILCAPVKSFGKCHMDDVVPEVDTQATVAHWCSVNTRTGSLTCVLEDNYCFDGEVYADELHLEENIDFREDQRINLGKWILRYLFADVIDEEIKRDEAFRHQFLNDHKSKLQRSNAPTNIELPPSGFNGAPSGPTSASTLKAGNGFFNPAVTPGLSIGLASPAITRSHQGGLLVNHLPQTKEEGTTPSETTKDKNGDYFSAIPNPGPAATPGGTTEDATSLPPTSPGEPNGKETKSSGFKFGKKFNMSFNMPTLKKVTTASSDAAPKTPAPAPEPVSSSASSTSEKTDDRVIEDNFFGCIQKIRLAYEDALQAGQTNLTGGITPSLPSETPVIKPPSNVAVIIQEDRPDSGGIADLFEGTVGSLGAAADTIEKMAPMWLADMLLRNQMPLKEIQKVSFVLNPYDNLLPAIADDGNNRLNANRMLRAKKICGYVAERVEPQSEQVDPNAMKPEEYLELYCHGQLIPPTMTLASIRQYLWRGGGDVVIQYKANGKKEISHYPQAFLGMGAHSNASEGKLSSEAGSREI